MFMHEPNPTSCNQHHVLKLKIKRGRKVSVLDPTAVVLQGMETISGLCDIICHEVLVAKKTHAQISQKLQDSIPVRPE